MKSVVAARWERAVLVCAKCSKRAGGGFGEKGKRALARELRREPGFGKGRKAQVGVAEVKCLGICPKHAVVVVDTQVPERWRLVKPGSDVAALAAELRGD